MEITPPPSSSSGSAVVTTRVLMIRDFVSRLCRRRRIRFATIRSRSPIAWRGLLGYFRSSQCPIIIILIIIIHGVLILPRLYRRGDNDAVLRYNNHRRSAEEEEQCCAIVNNGQGSIVLRNGRQIKRHSRNQTPATQAKAQSSPPSRHGFRVHRGTDRRTLVLLFIRFFSQSTLTFYTYLCDHPNCRSIWEIIPLLGNPPTPLLDFLSNTQFNVSLCYLWWGSHLMGIAVPRCKIRHKKIAQIPKGIEIEELFLESPSNPLIYRSIDRFDSIPNVMLLTSWYLVHVLPQHQLVRRNIN